MALVLVVGGFLAYKLFLAPPEAGTPDATADAFVKAAVANDDAKVRALCDESVADRAVQTAGAVRAAAPALLHPSWQRMKTSSKEAEYAAMALVSGRMLGIEMKRDGGVWKIVTVTLAD